MGFTFLTPIDALFALAAAVPLAALWLAHSRMEHVRRRVHVEYGRPDFESELLLHVTAPCFKLRYLRPLLLLTRA